MKKALQLLLWVICINYSGAHAQSYEGLWLSAGGKRVYKLYIENDSLKGSLESSVIPSDSIGKNILLSLVKKKGQYRGLIASPQDDDLMYATIRLIRPDLLQLKVRRLLVMSVKIRWTRIAATGSKVNKGTETYRDTGML
jgi:hypothetical protein